MGWRGRVSAGGTTERGKRRAKWYAREGPGVPCQRDTGNFFAAGEIPCLKATLLSRNRSIIDEIMTNQRDL